MQEVMLPFFSQMAIQMPVLLIYLVGIGLAVIFWRRYPRAAKFTLVAMLLLLLNFVGQRAASVYVAYVMGPGVQAQRLGWLMTGSAFIGAWVQAVALGLLLAAIFSRREVGVRDGEGQ